MASSRRSRPANADRGAGIARVREAVSAALRAHAPAARRIAVALSGGRDSIALLDATDAYARAHGIDLAALHVHHGLSQKADAWAAFCVRVCAERTVACVVTRVEVPREPRLSVEAEARRARYAALEAAARARAIDVVLLAHHADDQVETVLLQLARGAGPHGLAAMPIARRDRGVLWLRPWIEIARGELDAYIGALGLEFVDDESNAEPRFRRNAFRRDVVPALRAHTSGYPQTLVRAAMHQADAASLLDELAAIDAASAFDGVALDCGVLTRLSEARARNLLRWFLRQHGLPPPSLARLNAMLEQIADPRRDARI